MTNFDHWFYASSKQKRISRKNRENYRGGCETKQFFCDIGKHKRDKQTSRQDRDVIKSAITDSNSAIGASFRRALRHSRGDRRRDFFRHPKRKGLHVRTERQALRSLLDVQFTRILISTTYSYWPRVPSVDFYVMCWHPRRLAPV